MNSKIMYAMENRKIQKYAVGKKKKKNDKIYVKQNFSLQIH